MIRRLAAEGINSDDFNGHAVQDVNRPGDVKEGAMDGLGDRRPAEERSATPPALSADESSTERWADADPRDPGVLTILSTEHWGLLSARSLVYNETFTRVGSFLTLVSMSLVGLALLAQGRGFDRDFLLLAAIILVFDLLVGLATIVRLLGAIDEDLRAVHGMSRLRHAYLEVAPYLRPYFTTPTNDDLRSVMTGYGKAHTGLTGVVYFLSTSLGLMTLLVAVIAGLASAIGVSAADGGVVLGVGLGVGVALTAFVSVALLARRSILAGQAALESLFPSTPDQDQPA